MTSATPNPAPEYRTGMSKPKVIGLVLVMWVMTMVIQSRLDARRHYYSTGTPGTFAESIRNNLFGASMLGLREVIAGMLWVKADELFHEGRYQELVPYFSLVTFLDPHQIDVYSTGAWHLTYNFGDPRLVPQGIAFLKDGIKNNATVWDLYFQLGWLNFDWPVEDYEAALPMMQAAATKIGTDGTEHPRYIDHMIAHTLTRLGKIDESLAEWKTCLNYASTKMKESVAAKDTEQERFWSQEYDVCRNNYQLTLIRKVARQDLPLKSVSMVASVKRIAPRVLRVQARLIGLPVFHDEGGDVTNARVEVRLEDHNYNQLLQAHINDLPYIGKNMTKFRKIYCIVETDGTVTESRHNYVQIDLNADPAGFDPPRKGTEMFPLTSKDYDVVIRFDPRVRRQPEAIDDVYGWVGEKLKPGPLVIDGPNGSRAVQKVIVLKKEQIT